MPGAEQGADSAAFRSRPESPLLDRRRAPRSTICSTTAGRWSDPKSRTAQETGDPLVDMRVSPEWRRGVLDWCDANIVSETAFRARADFDSLRSSAAGRPETRCPDSDPPPTYRMFAVAIRARSIRCASSGWRKAGGLPNWPEWCWVPMSRSFTRSSWQRADRVAIEKVPDTALVTAVFAAWRETQGVYRFDRDVLDALWHTPVSGNIPAEGVRATCQWCVRRNAGSRDWPRAGRGFFAHADRIRTRAVDCACSSISSRATWLPCHCTLAAICARQ